MSHIDTAGGAEVPLPHPLARELATYFALQVTPRVLVLGYGTGRNIPVLLEAGAHVTIFDDDAARANAAAERFASDPRVRVIRDLDASLAGRFAGALSTHALLHGTPATIASAISRVRGALPEGSPFFLTLGTKSDARFGSGVAVAPDTYAAVGGSEAGVAHAYFGTDGLRAVLRDFTIDALEDTDAATTAGDWAHTATEAASLRHWFVRARAGTRDHEFE